MISAQRKNIEALTAANQIAFEGVQNIAKRQMEIARKATEEMSLVAKELTVTGSPEDKMARHAALAKDAFETAVANLRELSRSEEHTSELQSLMRISYAVFCLKNKNQ